MSSNLSRRLERIEGRLENELRPGIMSPEGQRALQESINRILGREKVEKEAQHDESARKSG